MKGLYRISLLFLIFLLITNKGWSTHLRAGELRYSLISGYTYEVTLVTYCDANGIDRDRVDIYFGDGKYETVLRSEQKYLGNAVIYNRYTTTHTYPGAGFYIISHMDHNRNASIINIPNSVNTAFYIETELLISPIGGTRSPVLLQPPIDFACVGHVFVHNPNAYDPDGDSLHFMLVTPKQDKDLDVNNYSPLPGNVSLDGHTGQLVWNYPPNTGTYNIAIRIEKYRHNVLIGYVIRDMQIIVKSCVNNPPVVQQVNDTCVEAGTVFTLKIPFHANDPDSNEVLKMTATGGPFILSGSPAIMVPNPAYGVKTVNAMFKWNVDCRYIRKEPYQVVVKAVDTAPGLSFTPLADMKPFYIKVVGPAPENLSISRTIRGIDLNWDPPSKCDNVRRYNIYRRADTSFWDTTRCETGIPGYTGFVLIDTVLGNYNTHYFDNDHGIGLVPGVNYCYRVTASYLNDGNYEIAEGYASAEVCAIIKRDLPVLTHASVLATSDTTGKVYVDWARPVDLDTTLYKPPYKYRIYRASNATGKNSVLVKTDSVSAFYLLHDTVLYDSMLNTRGLQYSYYIEFYCTDSSKDFLIGRTPYASTPYLSIQPAHKALVLRWSENVPWYNDHFIVYKQNRATQLFDSIGTTKNHSYRDTGLINGESYCYKIETYGGYRGTELYVHPIRNFSQVQCASPRDTIPPCPPSANATSDCDSAENHVFWSYDFGSVCDSDVIGYKIYFRDRLSNDYIYVGEVKGHDNFSFIDKRPDLIFSQAGCYRVTAIDKYLNESIPGDTACVENCPDLVIPNVFTPNHDNINDKLIPLKISRHIENIDFKVFNRWGQLVFETNDPGINWDGVDKDTKKDCSPGTYYYICVYNKMYREGDKPATVSGTITIFR